MTKGEVHSPDGGGQRQVAAGCGTAAYSSWRRGVVDQHLRPAASAFPLVLLPSKESFANAASYLGLKESEQIGTLPASAVSVEGGGVTGGSGPYRVFAVPLH